MRKTEIALNNRKTTHVIIFSHKKIVKVCFTVINTSIQMSKKKLAFPFFSANLKYFCDECEKKKKNRLFQAEGFNFSFGVEPYS